MPRSARETKTLRERILELVYEAAWGSISRPVQWKLFCTDLGLSSKEMRSFILTLEQMGYIRRTSSDTVHITLEGLSKIEESEVKLSQPPSGLRRENEKSIIFISHINEDKELAASLKSLLESIFGNNIDIFVSSDKESIPYGTFWFSEIKDAVSKCAIALILCSNISIKEPWINFETGAAFMGDRRVIPLCYGGLEPDKLPVPLNYLQAARAYDAPELAFLIKQISKSLKIESNSIEITDSDFYKQVNNLPNAEKDWFIAAVVKDGSIHKKGDTITITGVAKSSYPTADLHLYKLDKKPQELLYQKIEIEGDHTFLTQFATSDYPIGEYGATIELPSGKWSKITFSLE